MHRILSIFLAVTALLTTACQTSALNDFQKVKPGMEKQDVLELMGNPSRTERFHGKDRWTYVFYDSRIRFQKEVQFFEGNAIYVGNTWEPPVEQSAAVVDKRNDERNAAIDAELAKEAADNKNAFMNYEAKVRGEDKVHYLPEFKPLQ